MACSATKVPAEKPVPAIELYDGPMWQTLRKYAPQLLDWETGLPPLECCVLSGKHGFIGCKTKLMPYEARLSEQKAAYLMKRGPFEANDEFGRIKPGRGMGSSPYVVAGATQRVANWRPFPYTRVVIAAAEPYRLVFEVFSIAFQRKGLIAADAQLHVTQGGIGEQRGQLGEWLREAAAVTERNRTVVESDPD
jgi:hypothetical protein